MRYQLLFARVEWCANDPRVRAPQKAGCPPVSLRCGAQAGSRFACSGMTDAAGGLPQAHNAGRPKKRNAVSYLPTYGGIKGLAIQSHRRHALLLLLPISPQHLPSPLTSVGLGAYGRLTAKTPIMITPRHMSRNRRHLQQPRRAASAGGIRVPSFWLLF